MGATQVNPSEIDWARLAAYIDGEGSIAIASRCKKGKIARLYTLHVTIYNTDVRLMEWCRRVFGCGRIVIARGPSRIKSPKHKLYYEWRAIDSWAAWLLESCLPFLILKKDQAEIGLAFKRTFKPKVDHKSFPMPRVPAEVLSAREGYKRQLSALKRSREFNGYTN